MMQENSENEISNIVKPVDVAKVTKGMCTPKSVRPSSSKSASKGFATPKSLFSPGLSMSGREAARMAKLQSTAERIKKVNDLKEKWAKEKEIHAQLNKEKRANELKKLQEETDAAASARKKALDMERTYELLEKQREKDLLAASLEERNQLARDLEQQSKAKRRISIFLNSKIRNAALKKEAEMKAQKQQEMITELSDRRTDFFRAREAKKREDEKRRESLVNRGLAAQQQREAEQELARKAAEEEAALMETRHLNWEDDHKAKQRQDELRRQSMAGRLDHWREQKKVAEAEQSATTEHERDLLETRHQNWEDERQARKRAEEQRRLSIAGRLDHWREQKHTAEGELLASKEHEHGLMESRRLDHQDMDNYKKSLVQRDRQSLAGRLQKWREQKEDPGLKALAASMERDLQEAALEDVRAYRQKLEAERRESLAYRLEKARKDKTFEAGQRALKALVEEEERRLKEQEREDVKKYRERIQEDRRRSVQFKNEAEMRDRHRQDAEKQQQKATREHDAELRRQDWERVREYQAQQRELARRSLANRIAEAHRQKEADLEEHRQKMDAVHMDFELRRLDHLEMREFREEEKVRSRRSIALRLASWKDDKLRKEKERAKEDIMRVEEAMLQEQDREDLHAAKLALELMERQSQLSSEMNK